MSLAELLNPLTDKGTIHTYVETYEKLFGAKKNGNINILEIGIQTGGSIKLWRDYFLNGKIYGVDIINMEEIQEQSIKYDPRVTLFTGSTAYDQEFVKKNLSDIKFDFIIDDGPHSLESMIFFVKHYAPLLKDDGALIIEDVQDYSWLETIKQNTSVEYHPYIKYVDIRHIKGRYDDLMFIIDKSGVL